MASGGSGIDIGGGERGGSDKGSGNGEGSGDGESSGGETDIESRKSIALIIVRIKAVEKQQ